MNLKDTSRPDKNYIRFNQVIPESITQYSSAQDVMAANGNKPFYLKHKLIDNVVTESYIEFVITEVMANNNPGLTAGTYAIRGLDTWDDVNNRCKSEYYDELNDKCNSIYYEYNKNVLQNAFGTSYCNEYEPNNFEYYCSVSNLEVYADSEGAVSANGNGLDCGVYSFGASYC